MPGDLRWKNLARRILETGHWLLSVSGLGAVSAESCGRDSFAEAAGLASEGLVCLLRLTTIKPSEIVEGLQSPPRVILRLTNVVSDTAAVD
jgi:hypothetical protein